MAKYGLGCQAHAFQSILERGRCSARSMAFHLSGELWNTSPTYRCRYHLLVSLSPPLRLPSDNDNDNNDNNDSDGNDGGGGSGQGLRQGYLITYFVNVIQITEYHCAYFGLKIFIYMEI